MFTGIVETTGRIGESRPTPGGRRLRIDVGALADGCAHGASVCVSGVCLTVADRIAQTLVFDVIAETLGKSTLGSKRPGDRVNLERSLQVGDRLDGHFVQGHVDGTARVTRIVSNPREHVVWLRPQPCLRPYMIPKGSVAVDGVSLTLAAVEDGDISVALIPTTLDGTTLCSLAAGDSVNIETDIIARTVVHRLSNLSGAARLTSDALEKAGFA